MGKEHQKRVLAALMAASIAIPTPVLAASPADFSDFPNNWAASSLSHAVSNGLLSGDNGKIRANDTLKRAEMAAILNRLAGGGKEASLTGYGDVPATAWYYGDMAKAVQMGILKGDGGMLRPEEPITREEVFAVLARFYCLDQGAQQGLEGYADSSQIAPWARGAVAAMIQAGYVHGSEGKIGPRTPMTRAEFSQVLYHLAGSIAQEGIQTNANVEGNLVVRSSDASLDNVTVKGDLIIADGAQRVKLDNVKVEGRILIRGGADTVEFSKTTAGKGVLAANPTQPMKLAAKDSSLGTVTLWNHAALSGEFDTVSLPKGVSLTLEKGKIGAVQVQSGAEDAKIQVEKDGVITKVDAKGKGAQVSGAGTVTEVFAGSDQVRVSTEKTKVTTDEGVSGVQADGKEVQPKTSVTTEQKGEKKGEDGPVRRKKHSSGSTSQKKQVHDVSNWKGLEEALQKAKEGDTIRLRKDITAENARGLSIQTKELTVDGDGHTLRGGKDGALSFLIDGKGGTATGMEIKNLVLEGAAAKGKSMFTVKDGAEVIFRNVTVKGMTLQSAEEREGGSALYIHDDGKAPIVTIVDCTFENNGLQADHGKSIGRGGAVYIHNQKSKEAVKVTVKDTTFRGNSAAYGGAMAADGTVELTVEGCTFAGNTGTAADDIYLFEGVVKGTGNEDIISAVRGTLRNNTYTNPRNSKEDLTAMNVIFGRYYPETFSGTKGTAPQDAVDLHFSDGERTKVKEKQAGVLADGVWYGTGTDSLYYDEKGPDVVRVIIKNGRVSGAYSTKHIEDETYERGQNILNHAKNMSSAAEVDKLEEQLRQKTGAAYDAVSGATETAKGHLSALKNALLRAEKYADDQVTQTVQWFDFEKKPKANMYFGEKLDLTGTVLKVHLANGETKSVPFAQLSQYGITVNVANGTVITKDTPGVNRYGALQVQFQQADGLIMMPAKVVASKKTMKKVPTHLLVTFVDGKNQKILLDEKEFNYTIQAEGKIKDIKVYDGDRLLTEAVYHEEYNDWEAFLGEVSPDGGFTGWKYNTYYISVDNQTDDSAVASFTLDTDLLQKVYGVGYQLDLSQLNINLVTEKGSQQRKEGWDACEAKGFTAEPNHNYTFTKEDAQKGTKTIQIKNNGKTQSFDVQVVDYEKQIPAKIQLSSKTGDPIQTINIPGEKWKNAKGMYSLYDVKMPEAYKKWETDTFMVQVYNEAGEVLSDHTIKKAIDGKALEITFPRYTEYDSYGGYVRLFFDFSGDGQPVQPEGDIADGQWYGTATWGRYYGDRGPNVVKVTVKDGVITQAESIQYTDDTNAIYAAGKKILEKAIGLSDLSDLSRQLKEKKGEAYDAVSAATETAQGHLSAMENALEKAKQYSQDQKDQQVAWMEFKQKPALLAKFGMPLDLSQTELTLHMTDGKEKTLPFHQLEENGILTDHKNGTVITKETPGVKDGAVVVKFTHGLSKTTILAKITFLEEVKQKLPTHILVTLQDEKTKKIQLEENKFRYGLETEGAVKAMAIYDNEQKLADGVFEDGYNSWKFALKGVSAGDGYTGWKYENYFVDLDTSADDSPVASFTLDTSLVPKQYAVGEALQLDKLNISLKTEKGSSQRLNGWVNCRGRGFAASLENGHRFTAKEVGKQTITISVGDVQQTFQVEVKDYASQIPGKVEIYDSAKDTLLKTIPVGEAEWKKDKGCVTKTGIELPETYKDWNGDTFKVKVYNRENDIIKEEHYTVGQDYYKEALEIDFPHYQEYYSEGGYLKMYFSFRKTTEESVEEPAEAVNATAQGSATAGEFGYDAKVTVTYNKKTKEIVSVTDNGTEAGSNGSFWEKAVTMLEKFKGKTAKDIDGIDAVTSATVSSDAIKEAVKKALGEETEEADAEEATETAEGSKTVSPFGYDAKVTVTYNKKTKEIVSVTDNGTEAGSNGSFWEKAVTMLEKFKGKTAKDIDGIDAVTSATVSSDAIKEAVKEALAANAGEVPVPAARAMDLRTSLLYAATENALLNISAPEGAEVFYTTDGSDPTGDDDSKKKLNQRNLSLKGSGTDADETLSLKLAARKDGKWSKVTEIPLTFVKIPPLGTGTKVYEGQAECKGNEGKPYTVKVRVTTVNGRIALLEDNGTEIPGYTDEAFWLGGDVLGPSGMPEKLKGKTLEEVLKARTTPSDKEEERVDAISGATLSSDAVKYAVIDALRSRPLKEGPGEMTPPTFQSGRQVAPNGKLDSIFVTMKAQEGAVIHYTTDGSEPTEESPTPSKDPIFQENSGAELKAERETYPDGRIVLLKAAAYEDGKRSETVTARYVFANPHPKRSYQLGQFTGKAEGITAKVEFESPRFDGKYYLTKIRLDDASQKMYAAFLPELFSQIYLKQGVEGVASISGHEEESKKVLAAVQAALQEGSVAAEPVITVSPKQGDYGNDDKVTVEITCATDEAEIYYVVDNSNDLTGGKLSDFEKNKVLYDKPLTLTIDHPAGGKLFIRAAAKMGEKNWSPTARKDLIFVKALNQEAFQVNGKKYGTWKEAVNAVEEAGSGEIILRDDVELQAKDAFPAVSCTIRSGDERKCRIKGGVMGAKADITFENVVYDVNRIYGNGHSVTIGADVETPFSFTRRSIFAGAAHDAKEKEITANPVLSVESGKFALYGSGSSGTTLRGNVEIRVKGTADAEVAGAYMTSTVEGKISVTVEERATLSEFLGELSKGSAADLLLTITGSAKVDGRTFRGTVNGAPKGTLDLRQAALSQEQREKFKDFAELLTEDSPAAEETLLIKPAAENEEKEKEEKAAEEAAAIEKIIEDAISDFSMPEESDFL